MGVTVDVADPQSTEAMAAQIGNPDPRVRDEVLEALHACGWKPPSADAVVARIPIARAGTIVPPRGPEPAASSKTHKVRQPLPMARSRPGAAGVYE